MNEQVYNIDEVKYILEKAVVEELYKKDIIEFNTYNKVIEKINEKIKFKSFKKIDSDEINQIIVDVPLN